MVRFSWLSLLTEWCEKFPHHNDSRFGGVIVSWLVCFRTMSHAEWLISGRHSTIGWKKHRLRGQSGKTICFVHYLVRAVMSFNFSDWSLGASVAEAGWHLSQSVIRSFSPQCESHCYSCWLAQCQQERWQRRKKHSTNVVIVLWAKFN